MGDVVDIEEARRRRDERLELEAKLREYEAELLRITLEKLNVLTSEALEVIKQEEQDDDK